MGSSRGGAAALGHYLESIGENERTALVEIKGTVAQDIVGAIKEMEAYAQGTKCEKPLYHLMVCPQPGYSMTPEQFLEAVEVALTELGLQNQPRVVVAHEKPGEEHRHVVVARIDLETMKAIPDSHNYAKHEKAARELERRFEHPHVQGVHAERENVPRPERSPTRAELRQEGITGIKSKDVRQEVTALFRASGDAATFKEALETHGYLLAKGDRRDFVIVDRAGGDHSLARRISGMKAAELREFMAPIDRDNLPTVEDAIQIARDRMRGASEFDRKCWEDALAANAIEKEISADQARENNIEAAKHSDREHDVAETASRKWDDALSKSAIERAALDEEERQLRRQQAREARGDALMAARYAKGDGYVQQTQAALEDHKRRQDMLDADRHPQRPTERSEDDERIARILDDHDRDRQKAGESSSERKNNDRVSAAFENIEMTEAQQQRMERMLNNGDSERPHSSERDDLDPDRQREAPGGGRARGR